MLPYINADPVLAKRLQDVGIATVMPLGSPIGSNRGIETRAQIEIIIEQATVPVVVDAGIGAPSQAAEAMEMGADAVLVNTAIAIAPIPRAWPPRLAKPWRPVAKPSRSASPKAPTRPLPPVPSPPFFPPVRKPMKLLFAATFFALSLLPLRAADTPTPEALAEQQLAAMRLGEWSTYAANMHPKALDRLQKIMAPILDAVESDGDKSGAAQLSAMLFGGASAAQLKAMSPAKFFETLMSSMAKLPGMTEAMQSADGTVLGTVMEGKDTAHVVTRMKMNLPGMTDYSKLDVISFEKDGDRWKGLLSGDMELKMSQIMQRVKAQKNAPQPAARK